MNKGSAIEVSALGKSYKNVKSLENISFEVGSHELFGFIGPDGAGKTTLFRILATLLLPDTGEAKLMQRNVRDKFREIRKIIGYMPGKFSLYQDLTVEENLKFFATIFNTTIEENYHIIKPIYSQIEPYKTRRAGNLSGGMKQKLALSCALVHKPEILILDEPTTGVDAVSRKEFWEMLKELKSEGITIIVSTPYMDEAMLCDRVALIQKGKIMAIDKPSSIIDSFAFKILAIRSDNMYKLNHDLKEYQNTGSINTFGQYVHYTGKNDEIDINDINKYLHLKQHQNVEIKEIRAGIEDCFIQLMSERD
jgi:ABC-2 type transport system ATP-binding protein